MENKYTIPGAIIIAGLIIAGAVIYIKNPKTTPTEPTGNNPPTANISIDGEPMIGDQNAKITMVEFSDFECPYCATFSLEVFPEIKKEYVDTGKVKVVFKNFPLPFHNDAAAAALAAECANEQNKFWEYEAKLFENQSDLSKDNLKKLAADLGLDANQFNECLDTSKYQDEVKNDMQEGIDNKVEGTPSFFINGELVVGALPFSEFQKIFEEKLK